MTNTAITAEEIPAIMDDVVDLFGGVMEDEPEPTPGAEGTLTLSGEYEDKFWRAWNELLADVRERVAADIDAQMLKSVRPASLPQPAPEPVIEATSPSVKPQTVVAPDPEPSQSTEQDVSPRTEPMLAPLLLAVLRFIGRCIVPRGDSGLFMVGMPAFCVGWFFYLRWTGVAVSDLTMWGWTIAAVVVFTIANGIDKTVRPDPGRYHAEQSAWVGHDYSGWSQCSASRSANLTGSEHTP